jgi:malonyl-CoA O-methyltransferase
MQPERPPTIDPVAAARWQQRPQTQSAWLHEEVARRMAQRLDWIVRQPRHWLHWEPVRGGLQAQQLLTQRYARAQGYVQVNLPRERALVRPSPSPWWSPRRWRGGGAQPAPGPVDLLWANMALHLTHDPLALMRRWYDALAPGGLLLFSCLGPDTLRELRALYQAQGWPAPAHEFTDMHDWGDMLLAAGFAEPVMDMERIVLTFESPERLLRELRELGRNLHVQRFAALRGRRWHGQLLQALRGLADPAQGGRLALTFEIIYGHAIQAPPRLHVEPETRIALQDLRRHLLHSRSVGRRD